MKIKQIKRICLSKSINEKGEQYQFLTSGYPNKENDGITFNSVDGIFMPNLIPDLEFNECDIEGEHNQGIEVQMYVRTRRFTGSKKIWCFGVTNEIHTPEFVSPFKPEYVKATKTGIKGSFCNGVLRLDSWNNHTYFPDKPHCYCFPLYMKVKRLKPKKYES